MACYNVGDHNILLCEREKPVEKAARVNERAHHSFTVSSDTFVQACKLFHERAVVVTNLVYRARGFFTGRELYFEDPSGNRLELRDPTWKQGMPEPPLEEIVWS